MRQNLIKKWEYAEVGEGAVEVGKAGIEGGGRKGEEGEGAKEGKEI
jgi:hypothetical protein